ncbi:MAG: hypothetical protein KDC73_07045 [Ignavibacteriae bacterium]|nr:hypothetical protein [Ignavibacteriota bacterium]MCB9244616.1 hypothetical protein [Ignavibacteriales bacterium]
MKKIVIIGNGGTGKSTLATHLGKKLGIEPTHLDKLAWKPGFEHVSLDEFRVKLNEVLQRDSFIVDGWSYHTTLKNRFDASDTIIFLDYPVWFCYTFAVKRQIQYAFKQNPYYPDNSRVLPMTGYIFKAMWRVYKQYLPDARGMLEEYKDKKLVLRFTSRKELKRYLKNQNL